MRLKCSLTVGPNVDNKAELDKYVRLLVSSDSQAQQENTVRSRITGVIEGELRAVVSSMLIEEVFNDRKHLQQKSSEFIRTDILLPLYLQRV